MLLVFLSSPLQESIVNPPPENRHIRSFVRRDGRITDAQRHALESLWAEYGVEVVASGILPHTACAPPYVAGDEVLDFEFLFGGRHAPQHLEIGIGMGDALVEMAHADHDSNYLGIDVHRPGLGSAIQKAHARGLKNLRVMSADAITVLQKNLPDASLEAVYLFFPDPWPKRRHHKRRIVNAVFAQSISRVLKSGGHFHMATDWQEYAQHMMDVMSAAPGYVNIAGAGQYVPRPEYRPLTKFEQRGQRLGHGIWDLIFAKK